MKLGRFVCVALLTALCLLGWARQTLNFFSAKSDYSQSIVAAQDFSDRGLYQKAIESYETALAVSETTEVRSALLDTYRAAYSDGVISFKEYKKGLEAACGANPECADYWEQMLSLLFENGSYREAYTKRNQAERAGAHSENLERICSQIAYAYASSRHTYTKFYQSNNGYTVVRNGSGWGVLNPSGDEEFKPEYDFITPYGEEQTALFCIGGKNRLFDAKRIAQAIIPNSMTEAKAYGCGLIPVCCNGKWQYLACDNNRFLPEIYDDASTFQNDCAVVKQNGKWKCIDLNGVNVSDAVFRDVKLQGSGEYCFNKIMIAAEDQYGIYEIDGKKANDFTAKDMDIYLGGYIAYQDASGLWGFVNTKGKIVIDPQFKKAKSFSNGLAAVYDGSAWGFINEEGATAIDNLFLDVGYFSKDGACLVSTVTGEYYTIKLRFPEVLK